MDTRDASPVGQNFYHVSRENHGYLEDEVKYMLEPNITECLKKTELTKDTESIVTLKT